MRRREPEYIYKRATLAVLAAARDLGIEVDVNTLAPTLRQASQDALIPSDEHTAVVRAIFADRRETLGIDVAMALPLMLAGLWGFLLRSSSTFGHMLQRAERYMRVINRYQEFVLEDRGTHVAMVCNHPDPSPFGNRNQIVCALLGHWIAWGRQLTHQPIAPDVARFQWPGPQDRQPFERFFGGRVEFGVRQDALLLRREMLVYPLPEEAPELAGQFEAYAAALVRRMTPQTSVAEQVREVIGEGLLSGAVSETAVAARLALTVRTMHRHLVEAGTSFRGIRDELLRQRAKELLSERRVPIAEVSFLLGYSDPSSFHRAFRRWTGFTPAEWRKTNAPQSQVSP